MRAFVFVCECTYNGITVHETPSGAFNGGKRLINTRDERTPLSASATVRVGFNGRKEAKKEEGRTGELAAL